VRVPQAHANDQVVRSAIRRFRGSLVVIWLITAAVTGVLVGVDRPALATVIPVLLYAGLAILALVLSRRVILRAKRQGNWFEGVPGRVSAQLTPPSHRHPPFIWAVLAAIMLAGATAVGVALYPTLPDPLPIHFTIAGVANAVPTARHAITAAHARRTICSPRPRRGPSIGPPPATTRTRRPITRPRRTDDPSGGCSGPLTELRTGTCRGVTGVDHDEATDRSPKPVPDAACRDGAVRLAASREKEVDDTHEPR